MSKAPTYVFMGTPPFAATILEGLSQHAGSPLAVITQPARPVGRGQKVQTTAVQQLADSRGWQCYPVENANEPAFLGMLRGLAPDLILVAAFGQILKKDLLELPRRYCLNVHASLLPKYRGAAPVSRAILEGDTETGITIQRMAKKLDTGDILVQKRIPIAVRETSATLLEKLAGLGVESLVESIAMIATNREVFVPQDPEAATYAAKLSKAESTIDWSENAERIRRKIYGLQPWPIAETWLGPDSMRIFEAAHVDVELPGPPGSLQTDHRTNLIVKCGDGRALSLTEIQLANRKKLPVASFLSAYRGQFPFARLGG